MSSSTPTLPPVESSGLPATEVLDSAEQIDASLRAQLMLLISSASIWGVVAGFLGLIAGIKLIIPGFWNDCAWITYGRIQPAASNALLFGFAIQAGFAVLLWLVCRLGARTLASGWTVLVGTKLWNLGVLVGTFGILSGDSTNLEGLEFPKYTVPILVLGYLMIGVSALMTFASRNRRELYVSQWYLLGAIFWFPWIYGTVAYLAVFHPMRGVVTPLLAAWFRNGVSTLWLSPLGIAVLYYFIPKITGRILYSRYLALVGFWVLAFSGAWATLQIGAPVPAWIVSVTVASSILLLIPLISTSVNLLVTLNGFNGAKSNIWPFIKVATYCFVISSLLLIWANMPGLNKLTYFTIFGDGLRALYLHGFVAMSFFAVIYYVLPRIALKGELSASLTKVHFMLTLSGVSIVFLALALGGWLQGTALANPLNSFMKSVETTSIFLKIGFLGGLLLFLGQIVFCLNVLGFLGKWGKNQVVPFLAEVRATEPARRTK
ncbi:MAG: hypothetical protein JWN25_1315 [Verrucomicrobiales bacterium]|nr:hypothetical protein [Verrucomicrobiales bacterium]